MTSSDAYLVLNMLPGIGPIRVRKLLDVFGSPEELLRQPVGRLTQQNGIGSKLAETISSWRHHVDLDAELRLADRAGVRVIPFDDPDYPDLLREIHDPPIVLYLRGNTNVLSRATQLGLGIVGSRNCTQYGLTATRNLTHSAVQAQWVIVSGLARGIDTVAHETTVKNNGLTIAVLGGGLQSIYPPENLDLAREICEKGALITEQPMRMRPDRRTFPMRNRIIAGLCRATLVIEAGAKSGSLITAQQALEQGRNVYAVPGRIDRPHSRGCHKLIKEGAKLVESIDDIMEDFSFLPGFELFEETTDFENDSAVGVDASPSTAYHEARQSAAEHPSHGVSTNASQDSVKPIAELTETETAVVNALQGGDSSFDEVAAATGIASSQLLAALSMMELKRLIKQLPGRRYTLYTN